MHNKFLLFVILINCFRGFELFVLPMYVTKMSYTVNVMGDLAPIYHYFSDLILAVDFH